MAARREDPVDVLSIANQYVRVCSPLLKASNGIRYSAHFLTPNPEALRANPEIYPLLRLGYVFGLLERSHLACIVSLSRYHRWLVGLQMSARKNNLLAFSACLRGFLEAAADSHNLFQFLPMALIERRDYFYASIHNPHSVSHDYFFGELEERLIHFSFAKRQPRNANVPESHFVKPTTDYIKALQSFGISGAMALYTELCELTHPAAASVECFLEAGTYSYTFNSNKDNSYISGIVDRYRSDLLSLVMYSFNPVLASLIFLAALIPGWPSPEASSLQDVPLVATNLESFRDLEGRLGMPMDLRQIQYLIELGTRQQTE